MTTAFISVILALIDKIVFRKELKDGLEIASKNFEWKVSGITGILYQSIIELAFLPYKSYVTAIAIIKTIYRMYISKQNLLEWLTAEQAEKLAITSKREYYKQMLINVLCGVTILFSINGNVLQSIIGIVMSIIWILGPFIAYNISKNIEKEYTATSIPEEEKDHLLDIAKRTWDYFACFSNAENNYLPPDNYEEARSKKIAPRTSPTNIGLGLISIISACDLKFISENQAIELINKTINTVEGLQKWNGHLYNWYNTETLEPLTPKYISSVDSGNFIGYLYVVKQFLINLKEKKDYLIGAIDRIIQNADFSKLYNSKKKLFSIGYDIEDNKLTDSYYDLLASEARQTSLIAIAKKDVPIKHWGALSRTLTIFERYKGLVSWSGTAFEYFMPNIVLKNYPGSIISESCKFMVLCQKKYCRTIRNSLGYL